ncbi:MAG: ABC transporter permease [Chloroflexota bacterium]
MKFNEVLAIAWEGVSRNKLRSLLTMLGVIIGVAAVIVMIAVSAGTEATIAERIETLGTNLLFVSANFSMQGPGARQPGGNSTSLTYDDALAIAGIKNTTGVLIERNTSQTVKFGNTSLDAVTVVGTTLDYPDIREIEVASGRFLTQKDLDNNAKVAILGYSLAQDLFGTANPVGQKITVGTVKVYVVGVMAEKGIVGNTDYDARLYLPITLVFDKFTPSMFARVMGNTVDTITVQVTGQDVMDSVITQIEILLAKRHTVTLEDLPYTVRTQSDIIETQAATTEAFRSLLAWVAAVSLLVGGIGIMNIMLVSVTERTREIGIRQATGATPGDIRLQFLSEALMLSLTGGLLGVLGGVGGAWVFNLVGQMRTVVVPNSIVLAFTSAAVVGIFFGFYPANKAAQLDPIEALRHE